MARALHQSGARFRQGWALRQVEQAWGALQQSRLNLNMGPRFPEDPRSQRIAAGNVSLKGARWADAIYADALLQATLRSATNEGRRGVRAHFTPTVEGRRYDASGVDLTARATTALNSAGGGGPVDWEEPAGMGADRFQAAVSDGSLESPVTEEFLKAISIESVRDNWLRAASASPYAASSARAYILTGENGGSVIAGLASAYVVGTPWIGSIAQDGYQATTGKDFMSGEELSAGWRAWSTVSVGLELVPGFAGAITEGAGQVVGAGMRGAKAAKAVMVKAGSQSLGIAGETARRGLIHAQAAGAAAKVGASRFTSGFAENYKASRRAQLARVMSDPLLGLGTELGHVAEGMSGGVKKLFRQTDEAVEAAARAPHPGAADLIGPRLAPENAASRFNRTTTPWQRNVYQRADIDWDFVRPEGVPLAGRTNRFAAAQGYAPGRINPKTGKWDDVVLHHLLDDPRGAVIETWRSSHTRFHNTIGRGPNDFNEFRGTSKPWRKLHPEWEEAWNNEVHGYWSWRNGSRPNAPRRERLMLPGDEP